MTVYIYVWYGNAVSQSIAATGNKPSEDPEYQWVISRNSRKYSPQHNLKMQWRQQVLRFLAPAYEPGGREFAPTSEARTDRRPISPGAPFKPMVYSITVGPFSFQRREIVELFATIERRFPGSNNTTSGPIGKYHESHICWPIPNHYQIADQGLHLLQGLQAQCIGRHMGAGSQFEVFALTAFEAHSQPLFFIHKAHQVTREKIPLLIKCFRRGLRIAPIAGRQIRAFIGVVSMLLQSAI